MLAIDRNISIVREYTDVVESAKSEFRPSFQELMRDLKDHNRGWSTLILTDTSRLSRRRYVAQAFKHQARKHGVDILYSKVPEVDPISAVILESVFEAMDEVHSLMSKEKGLAGMAENVKKGYRAGGRAPYGYRLKYLDTGAIREGQSVTKSTLEANEDANKARDYLKARARGDRRKKAKETARITLKDTSLIGMEWNALTYAGHTVWNVHSERLADGGYKGGTKRRPREEWHIQENTHEALITQDEAEFLLDQLANSSHSNGRRTAATYLLSGLLKTSDGLPWYGNSKKQYRTRPPEGKGRYIDKEEVEKAVVGQVMGDLRSAAFVKSLTRAAHEYYESRNEDPAKAERKQLSEINTRIGKNMDLAEDLSDPGPVLRRVDELEKARKAKLEEIHEIEREYTSAAVLANITENHVSALLGKLAKDMEVAEREPVKDILYSLVDKVTLEPDSLDCAVHYKIGLHSRNKVASPKLHPNIPALEIHSIINNLAAKVK